MDLFENYEQQPENLKEICDRYAKMDNCYIICEQFLKEVEAIGYTFEYGLDSQPFNLCKKITNVNTGICHRRIQEGSPAFFVNWKDKGVNNYEYFLLRFSAESFKNRLIEN